MRLRRLGLAQPLLEHSHSRGRDRVTLTLRSSTGLGTFGEHVPVALQPAQGAVDLPERQRLVVAEQDVVLPFQLVPMAWLRLEQAEQCRRDGHEPNNTLSVYVHGILALWVSGETGLGSPCVVQVWPAW